MGLYSQKGWSQTVNTPNLSDLISFPPPQRKVLYKRTPQFSQAEDTQTNRKHDPRYVRVLGRVTVGYALSSWIYRW